MRLFTFTRPFRILFIFALMLVFIEVTYYISYSAIQEYLINAITANNLEQLNRLLIGYSIGAVVLLVIFFILFFCNNYINELIQREISLNLFNKINRLPFSYFQSHHSGDLMSRLSSDVQKASQVIGYISFNSLFWITFFVSSFIYLSRISLILTLMIVLFSPLLFIIGKLFSKRLIRMSENVQESKSQVRVSLQEILQGMQVIRSFNLSKLFTTKYLQYQMKENTFTKKQKSTEYLMMYMIEALSKLISTLLFAMLGYSIINGDIAVGAFAVFITLIRALQQPIEEIIKELGKAQEGLAAAKRVFAVLDEEAESIYSDKKLRSDQQNIDNYAFEFVNVSFSYGKEKTLHELSFKINTGEKIAIVGTSGSGKTTFIRLCLGLLTPQSGEIKIFGRNSFADLEATRSLISYVPQSPYLFSTSILENVLYGDLDSDQDAIELACKRANAQFIHELPEEYHYNVGEQGRRLSGGQRQRISIARAFLKDAPIIVLDEATSALDNDNEKHIHESLDELVKNKTAIIIAHRLSTIINADRIIVFENGTVIESGKHDELILNNGRYAALYSTQLIS